MASSLNFTPLNKLAIFANICSNAVPTPEQQACQLPPGTRIWVSTARQGQPYKW